MGAILDDDDDDVSGQAIELFQAPVLKELLLPSICDTSLSSSMM